MFRVARVLLIVVALFAMPAAAQGATPFTAGSGVAPSVAVGPDGMGHIAWITTGANAQVGYCRVSPDGGACNRTEILNFGGATEAQRAGSKPRIFTPAPNKVVIVAGCWDCGGGIFDWTFRWISENNGASFSPTVIGSGPETSGHGTWLDESSIYVGTHSSSVKAAAPDLSEGVQYATGGIFVFTPEVARVPGAQKLVAATNDLDVVKYGVFKGPTLSVANINNVVNWETDKTLPGPEPDNSDTALNSGPNGVFLSYMNFVANDNHVALRRFDPATNTFGGPVYVEGADPIDNKSLRDPDSFQDPSGRIHAVWSTLHNGGRLRYTVSDPGAAAFSAAATLAKSEGFYEPEIAAGANGRGFVTWTPGTTGAIRVVPILPEAESGAATPPPPDTTSPRVTGFDVGDTTLRPGQKTKFTFRASEAGNAVLTFEKRFNGIKGKKKRKGKAKARTVCLPLTKKRLRALRKKAKSPQALRRILKKKRCRGFRRIGQIRQKVKAGVNSIAFNGRIAGQKLKPGHYRASLVITDSAGNVSRTERVSFRVVGQKKKKRRATR